MNALTYFLLGYITAIQLWILYFLFKIEKKLEEK